MAEFLIPLWSRSDRTLEGHPSPGEAIQKLTFDGQKEAAANSTKRNSPIMIHLVASLKATLLLFFTVLCVVRAANTTNEVRSCSNVLERHEWSVSTTSCSKPGSILRCRRTLTPHQQHQYTTAVQCLQRLPATSSFRAVKTRFDDFQALHINLTPEVHLVVRVLITARRDARLTVFRDNSFRGIVVSSVYSSGHCAASAGTMGHYRKLFFYSCR
jgi:hypothetical protein